MLREATLAPGKPVSRAARVAHANTSARLATARRVTPPARMPRVSCRVALATRAVGPFYQRSGSVLTSGREGMMWG